MIERSGLPFGLGGEPNEGTKIPKKFLGYVQYIYRMG